MTYLTFATIYDFINADGIREKMHVIVRGYV